MTTATALAAYQEAPEVVEAQTQALTIADRARGLEVVDEATNTEALTLLAECRKTSKRIEDLRKSFVAPLNEHVKNINAYFAQNGAPVKEADGILSQKTSAYRAKVAEIARKEQERLRRLQEARQEKAAAKAEARGEEAPPVIPLVPCVAAPAKTVDVGGAKVTYRKTPHVEIVDPDAVPRNWCEPDERKIRAALVNGVVAEIPGVKFWYTEEASVR